ncbi:MAG: hypothetical protein GWP14_10360 [Actinobacteria bacterium]|nr:hypothetical protein [Actinomycetota bacterium]
MSDFTERRAFSRMSFSRQVPLDIQGRPHTLTVAGVDISHSGARLNVPLSAPLAQGSLIELDLPRPSAASAAVAEQPSRCHARVVWVDRASRLLDGLAVVGLQFS